MVKNEEYTGKCLVSLNNDLDFMVDTRKIFKDLPTKNSVAFILSFLPFTGLNFIQAVKVEV